MIPAEEIIENVLDEHEYTATDADKWECLCEWHADDYDYEPALHRAHAAAAVAEELALKVEVWTQTNPHMFTERKFARLAGPWVEEGI